MLAALYRLVALAEATQRRNRRRVRGARSGVAGIWRWMKIVHRSARSNGIRNALRWGHGESPAPPAVLGVRMAAVRALLARAAQGRLHLRHCRLLFPRH